MLEESQQVESHSQRTLDGLGRAKSEQPALLAAYYMIAFLFGGNPLIISWIAGNTAGQSKKSTMLALCESLFGIPYVFDIAIESIYGIQTKQRALQGTLSVKSGEVGHRLKLADSAANLGPILFKSADKPYYKPGLKAVLCCFSSLLGLIMCASAPHRTAPLLLHHSNFWAHHVWHHAGYKLLI